MTNSAAYVGRVGGLAVALGIGAAVACSQQVAWADTPDSSSDPSGASASSPAPSESSSGSSGSSGSAPGHSVAGPPAGSTTANTTSDDSSATEPTADSEGSNIGQVDTDTQIPTLTSRPPRSPLRSHPRVRPTLISPTHRGPSCPPVTAPEPRRNRRPTSNPPRIQKPSPHRPAAPRRLISNKRRSTSAPPQPKRSNQPNWTRRWQRSLWTTVNR